MKIKNAEYFYYIDKDESSTLFLLKMYNLFNTFKSTNVPVVW